MKKKLELRKRYTLKDYSQKTVETMNMIIDSMEENFAEIDKAWISSLDLLALNYEMMYNAYDDIKNNGNVSNSSKERLSRNPAISIFLNCQNAIQNILSKTGLTVLSKARVRQLMTEQTEIDEFAETFGD